SDEKIKEGELQVEKYKTDVQSNTALTVEQMRHDAQERAKQFDARHAVGMEQMKGGQAMQLEHRRAQLKAEPGEKQSKQFDQHVQMMHEHLQNAVQMMHGAINTALTAQRRIRRDKSGKPTHVEVISPEGSVLAQQAIQRGPDGRIAG